MQWISKVKTFIIKMDITLEWEHQKNINYYNIDSYNLHVLNQWKWELYHYKEEHGQNVL